MGVLHFAHVTGMALNIRASVSAGFYALKYLIVLRLTVAGDCKCDQSIRRQIRF